MDWGSGGTDTNVRPTRRTVSAIVIELNTHHRRRRRGCFTCGCGASSTASAWGAKRNHGAGLVVVGGGGDVVTAPHDVIAVEPALGDPQAILEYTAIDGGCGSDVCAGD